jgi:hypothetical protein
MIKNKYLIPAGKQVLICSQLNKVTILELPGMKRGKDESGLNDQVIACK